MSFKLASLFAAAVITAVAIAPASAAPRIHEVSVRVSYADLDLTKVADVKTLSRRLERALDKVCGNPHGEASMTMVRAIRACRADSRAVAVAAIDAPLLTALYQGRETTRFAGR